MCMHMHVQSPTLHKSLPGTQYSTKGHYLQQHCLVSVQTFFCQSSPFSFRLGSPLLPLIYCPHCDLSIPLHSEQFSFLLVSTVHILNHDPTGIQKKVFCLFFNPLLNNCSLFSGNFYTTTLLLFRCYERQSLLCFTFIFYSEFLGKQHGQQRMHQALEA